MRIQYKGKNIMGRQKTHIHTDTHRGICTPSTRNCCPPNGAGSENRFPDTWGPKRGPGLLRDPGCCRFYGGSAKPLNKLVSVNIIAINSTCNYGKRDPTTIGGWVDAECVGVEAQIRIEN